LIPFDWNEDLTRFFLKILAGPGNVLVRYFYVFLGVLPLAAAFLFWPPVFGVADHPTAKNALF